MIDELKVAAEQEDEQYKVKPPRPKYTLNLTKTELIHLRDLLNIRLPSNLQTTLSQALAENEDRPNSEAMLWNSVVELCESLNVPLEQNAPDFVVGVVGIPKIAVYELAESDAPDEYEIEEGVNNGETISPFGA